MSPDFDIKKNIPQSRGSLGDRRPRGTCQGKAFMGGFSLIRNPPNLG